MKTIYVSYLILIVCLPVVAEAQRSDSLLSGVYSWQTFHTKHNGQATEQSILKGRTQALSHFEIITKTILPGSFEKGGAKGDELIIVKEGVLQVQQNDSMHLIGFGGIAFTMAGDSYLLKNKSATSATYYLLKYLSRQPADTLGSAAAGGSFALDWNQTEYTTHEKGGRREFFNRPTSHVRKFEMHVTALHPGVDSHAPHTHTEEEIVLILKGNVTMDIAGRLYKAAAGDIVFLSSGVAHALQNTGNEMCEYFAFQWRN
jgi:(S)-ureidoglycine aminohydrolase